MELEKIRKEIDRLDGEILRALNRRLELASDAGRLKRNIEDPEREAEVLRNVLARSTGLLDRDFSGALYDTHFAPLRYS